MGGWVVAALGILFGGGVLGQIAQAVSSHRVGVRNADVAEDRTLAESSTELIDRLETRLGKVEDRLAVVEEELSNERTVKWILVRYSQDLLDHISRVLGQKDFPHPPEPIRHYFPHYFSSRKDTP